MIAKLKRDKYRTARGGYSRLLNIHCRKCKALVAAYQKDGPGSLRRLYLDRVFAPLSLSALQNKQMKKIGILRCAKCREILGTPYTYLKESRKAFRLYQDAVIKRVRSLSARK